MTRDIDARMPDATVATRRLGEVLAPRTPSTVPSTAPSAALVDLNEACGFQPEGMPLHRERARALQMLGRIEEALAAWTTAQACAPGAWELLAGRAAAFAARRAAL